MTMKRRTFVKSSMSAAAVAVAAGAGLLTPRAVPAAYPKETFTAQQVDDVLKDAERVDSDRITVEAPKIAENGAVVPITIRSDLSGVEQIHVYVRENGIPKVAQFNLGAGAQAEVSCRVKMGKTSDVIGLVKSGDKLYYASKEVKVTIGGCGG